MFERGAYKYKWSYTLTWIVINYKIYNILHDDYVKFQKEIDKTEPWETTNKSVSIVYTTV